ncbi:Gfo/Idh/MocA family protein [Terribacillus saccharophilus]|uniref:Gfo/Idh/MocA family protein n=1 Tax=Terribacillus saccharophilus TaxID=361277 RepID=UPI002DC64F2B|nr:Gfo/Idh/MocA family oxidoreductase [Terribacillus saccharophilus]MEC0291726.1 Gfo/Idh/MocA family oxidoreductase [Terribacillus saccharophilus]
MIRFGIVGTNWITERFIAAGRQHGDFKVIAVYSRSEEKGQAFTKKHQLQLAFTDINEMAEHDDIDAVYIASPNALHAEQALLFIENGKHVLCEKPFASNSSEVLHMIRKAEEKSVVLMEAMKSTYMPNFLSVREHLHKIGPVRSYFSSSCRYSPFYDDLRNGTLPNLFNPALSGGSLMDLGVYTIAPLVALFGRPTSIQTTGTILASGVDGQGHMLLDYEEVKASIMFSCITNSYLPTEIIGEKGTIVVHHISSPKKAEIHYPDGTSEDISRQQEYDPMYYEIAEFIQLIQTNKQQSSVNTWENSIITMEILDQARRQMGVLIN